MTATTDTTRDEWLVKTQARRDAITEFCKSSLPDDISHRYADIDLSIQYQGEVEMLLADAESYLALEEGQQVHLVNREWPDLTAEERRRVAKANVRGTQQIVNALRANRNTLKSRVMAILNANRSR